MSSMIQQAVQDFNKECNARKMEALIDDNLRMSKELVSLTEELAKLKKLVTQTLTRLKGTDGEEKEKEKGEKDGKENREKEEANPPSA